MFENSSSKIANESGFEISVTDFKSRFKWIDMTPLDLANKCTKYRYLCMDLMDQLEKFREKPCKDCTPHV